MVCIVTQIRLRSISINSVFPCDVCSENEVVKNHHEPPLSRTVVGLDELLHQVQSQASTAVPPCSVHVNLFKSTEDLSKLVLRDTKPSVGNRYEYMLAIFADTSIDDDAPGMS